MTTTAQSRAHETKTGEDDGHKEAMLAALRVARARAMCVIHEIDTIGLELKQDYISPKEAMRQCLYWRIDSLFPRESDGA